LHVFWVLLGGQLFNSRGALFPALKAIGFDTAQAAGAIIRIESESGEEILTFAPAKSYQSVVISSPELGNGSYILYSGGASDGASMDGL
jgi:hypothetical protein